MRSTLHVALRRLSPAAASNVASALTYHWFHRSGSVACSGSWGNFLAILCMRSWESLSVMIVQRLLAKWAVLWSQVMLPECCFGLLGMFRLRVTRQWCGKPSTAIGSRCFAFMRLVTILLGNMSTSVVDFSMTQTWTYHYKKWSPVVIAIWVDMNTTSRASCLRYGGRNVCESLKWWCCFCHFCCMLRCRQCRFGPLRSPLAKFHIAFSG